MAYNTNKLIEEASKVIIAQKLIFIEEISSAMGISKNTFYDHHLHESDILKGLIDKNKQQMKAGLRKKWYENDNATTQLALYRLLSTTDEHKLLNQAYIDHTTGGDKWPEIKIIVEHSDEFIVEHSGE